MPNYSKGKIYQVVSNNYEMRYIGSTTQSLSIRFGEHKRKRETTLNIIFDTYGVENCKIELIEEFPCQNKEQLTKREGDYIRQLECVNKQIPNRPHKEVVKLWGQNNKEHITNNKRIWRSENKDKIKLYKTRCKNRKIYNDVLEELKTLFECING